MLWTVEPGRGDGAVPETAPQTLEESFLARFAPVQRLAFQALVRDLDVTCRVLERSLATTQIEIAWPACSTAT